MCYQEDSYVLNIKKTGELILYSIKLWLQKSVFFDIVH